MKITVNGEEIAQDVIEQEIQNQRRQNPRLGADQLNSLARQSIVDWTIIRQHANRTIPTVPSALIDNEYAKLIEQHGGEKNFFNNFSLRGKDVSRVKKDIEQNIKIKQFLRDLTRDVDEPTEADIERYYKKHAKEFTLPEQVHAAHIVMRPNPAHPDVAYEEMKALRQMVLEGADFAKIADEHSSCQDQGGDLGWFAPGRMVEAFDAIVFSMNIGEISPIFRTEFGYHIATVYEKRAAVLRPLQEVKADIVERLKTDKGDDLIGAWVDGQKESSDIRIDEE
ncbi:peptidylprolyl isomerase [candidate division KSB1 bacterium]|nr:peptidylprolyl isomerase [candidate division KSB1 bacterium]RQW07461.1 MAG: hypothetical protein EH222_07325 [candidate division KSB1 bacterium]